MFGRKKQQPAATPGRRSEQIDLKTHKKLQQMLVKDRIEEENVSENDKDEQIQIQTMDDDDPFGEMMRETDRRRERMTRDVQDDYWNEARTIDKDKMNSSVLIDFKQETKNKRTIIENDFVITTSVKNAEAKPTPHGFTITDDYNVMAQVTKDDKRRGDYMDSVFQQEQRLASRKTQAVLGSQKIQKLNTQDQSQFYIQSNDHFDMSNNDSINQRKNNMVSSRIPTIPKEEDYLDAQFKIHQEPKAKGSSQNQLPKSDIKKLGRMTVQIEDQSFKSSLNNKLRPQLQSLEDDDHTSPWKNQAKEVEYLAQQYSPQKEPESPEPISVNEETLGHDEDEEGYLEQVQQSSLKAREQAEFEANQSPERTGSILDQMRTLQNSIILSVSEMMSQEEKLNMAMLQKEEQQREISVNVPTDPALEFYQTMHQEVLMKGLSPKSKFKAQVKIFCTKDDWEYKDMLRIIDWNERRHQVVSNQQLKKNSVISLKKVHTSSTRIRILSPFISMNQLSMKMMKEQSYSKSRATSIGMTDDLILVGNTEGEVHMFDKQSEQEYSVFSEKSKDFLGNAVTALDVHPTRSEYVILGFERGQLVLIDVSDPKKSLKVIKDHHKGQPIGNVKFCDWQGSYFEFLNDKKNDINAEDKQAWMFISIDSEGRVILSYISKILFVLKVSKLTIIEPEKHKGPVYNSIACRFASGLHPTEGFDDIPLVAIGSAKETMVFEARTSKYEVMMKIERPLKFFKRSTGELKDFEARVPSLSWGFGTTPTVNDKTRSILTIAWGPLIQLVVLYEKDPDFPELKNFNADGYYILRNFKLNETPIAKQPRPTFMAPTTSTNFKKFLTFQESALSEDSPFRLSENEESKSSAREFDNDPQDGDSREKTYGSQYDQSEAFEISELDIEMIQFLSESTIFAVTQSQEFRILNISAFNSGIYDVLEEVKAAAMGQSIDDQSSNCPELEAAIRINQPIMMSEFGALYHQTIRFHQGRLAVLTKKNVQTCAHQSWQQSISEFKKMAEDDLVKVFSRALDLYKGKVRGYAGLPDNSYQRETKLKTEIKLLVREIIHQVILKEAKINQIMAKEQALIDDAQQSSMFKQSDEEVKEERASKYQTLIRIAIEFCIELKDPQFLFYDLFLLFKESKLEDCFIHELEPFIMAGKFQEWELPNEVIQNHVIKYYRDPSKADALEKIIVNMNLAQCPKTIVLEFIHYSEQHFLTTAVLFLYTQVFEKRDNTSCVQVIFSLFDLYKKAGKKNQGNVIDLYNLKEFNYDSKEKQQVVKSQVYLGFKILWVIRLFLNGMKFPQGKIRSKKWRIYIHDIMELLKTSTILKVLLDIDAESFFQTIAVVFYNSKPYQLFKLGRLPEPKEESIFPKSEQESPQPQNEPASAQDSPSKSGLDEIQGKLEEQKAYETPMPPDEIQERAEKANSPEAQTAIEQQLPQSKSMATPMTNPILSESPHKEMQKQQSMVSKTKSKFKEQQEEQQYCHADFIKSLDQFCMSLLASEHHKLNYLFFVADVVAYSEIEGLHPHYFYSIVKELIIQHKRYRDHHQKLQNMLQMRNAKLVERVNKYRQNKIDSAEGALAETHYFNKAENNILNLLKLAEPLEPLQIVEMIRITELTPLDQVKILLMEKKEEHSKWLSMVISDARQNTTWTQEVQRQKAISMICSKLDSLEAKAQDSSRDRPIYEQFKREVAQSIEKILLINPAEAIHMVSDKLGGSHKEMIDQLHREPKLQMQYLDILIQEKEEQIQESIKKHGLGQSDPQEAKRFVEFLKLHLRLCCQYHPERVVQIVEKMMKNTYYPIDDCLIICQEFNAIDATFRLNRKLGKYFDCIQQGLQILKERLNLKRLRAEVFYATSEEQQISLAFPMVSEILIECSEFDARLKQLTKICRKHYKEVEQDKEELIWFIVLDTLYDFSDHELIRDKLYCKNFFRDRMRAFSANLIDVIPLRSFLQHIVQRKKHIRFKEYRKIVLSMFGNKLQENSVLSNANNAIFKVNSDLFHQFRTQTQKGILFRQRQCPICKQYVDKFLYEEGSTEIDEEEAAIAFLSHQEEEEQEDFEMGMPYALDPQNEPLKIFACKHSYHLKCLEKSIRKRKKNESDEAYRRRIEKLRCPTCNIRNYEIESTDRAPSVFLRRSNTNTPKTTPKGGKKINIGQDMGGAGKNPRKDSQLSGNSGDQLDPRESMMKMRRESIIVNEFNRRMQLLSRKMVHHEHQQEFEGLTMKDFRQIM